MRAARVEADRSAAEVQTTRAALADAIEAVHAAGSSVRAAAKAAGLDPARGRVLRTRHATGVAVPVLDDVGFERLGRAYLDADAAGWVRPVVARLVGQRRGRP